MIKIGIDSVEIERFIPWINFSQERLLRIFSQEEITYSLSVPRKAAERLAVRFAAKEAFYKAAIPLLAKPVPFLTLAKQATITFGAKGEPHLNFSWEHTSEHTVAVSLTHTKTTATAIVLISSNLKHGAMKNSTIT